MNRLELEPEVYNNTLLFIVGLANFTCIYSALDAIKTTAADLALDKKNRSFRAALMELHMSAYVSSYDSPFGYVIPCLQRAYDNMPEFFSVRPCLGEALAQLKNRTT